MVFVVSNTTKPLMPTSSYKARRLMKQGRAKIFKHRPFTIMILDRADGKVQEIEYKSDTGYLHVGISVCSEKHEYLSRQMDLLDDEVEKHNGRRKYRRIRRNRERYRKVRFDNRIGNARKAEKRGEKWLPPSLNNKVNTQVQLYRSICEVVPISHAYFEMGKFDPVLMKALEKGDPIPQGEDYQKGERYQANTLRAAVFVRDAHKCVFCERGIKEHAVLHVHHIGFWKGDRTNRLSNLATCCELCHTPENHQPGGVLYGQTPKISNMAPTAYMNAVRFELFRRIKEVDGSVSCHMTYGAQTAVVRRDRSLPKSHTNDAYCIGRFYPKHRCAPEHFKKVRRNDRVMRKFFDAVFIDARTGEEVHGKDLTNGRISRNHKKDHENLHPYRKQKLKKGYFTIRRRRTSLKPGSLVKYNGEILPVHGTHTKRNESKKTGKVTISTNVEFGRPASDGRKSASIKKCTIIQSSYNTGWIKVTN